MKLAIYTIEKTLYEGEIQELVAKTSTGEITILENHIPLISRLIKAPLRIIETSGAEKTIDITAGFLEVQPENNVVVLVDTH
ncbi:MAG: synthase subunit epsilon [Candidatus Paceibacter sp.]|jgi:F-type H+-transporting ATPase subunit epsilon|nr:synthase subunit epsilon [Candidatus Paceibacter sp.]